MAERRLKRPRDPIQLAKLIGDIATGQVVDRIEETPKTLRGRKGGAKGGAARAKRLTPEQRSETASLAAAARWKKPRVYLDPQLLTSTPASGEESSMRSALATTALLFAIASAAAAGPTPKAEALTQEQKQLIEDACAAMDDVAQLAPPFDKFPSAHLPEWRRLLQVCMKYRDLGGSWPDSPCCKSMSPLVDATRNRQEEEAAKIRTPKATDERQETRN